MKFGFHNSSMKLGFLAFVSLVLFDASASSGWFAKGVDIRGAHDSRMMRHNIATRSCLSVVASHVVKRTNHATIPQGGSSSNSSSSWLPRLFRVRDYRTSRNEESSNLSEGSNHEGARQRWRELPPVPPQMALQALLQSQNYQTKAGMQNFGTLKP